jgi:hypothetical protein
MRHGWLRSRQLQITFAREYVRLASCSQFIVHFSCDQSCPMANSCDAVRAVLAVLADQMHQDIRVERRGDGVLTTINVALQHVAFIPDA